MNVLLVYPKYPNTFWSYNKALRFVAKKAAVPPLGLITASALLPESWEKKLIDMNVSELHEKDIEWADYIFISAMYIQKESVNYVIEKCSKYKAIIVAGGPLFTQEYMNYPQINHFVLNEAEITLPPFLRDIEFGITLERIYQTNKFSDLAISPVPDYYLLNFKDYVLMSIQVSRGCPFACDFCEITTLLGHKVRMKSSSQIINELETLYNLNWRGPVSIVDDNFIGNKKEIKDNLLPAIKEWMQSHKHPFTFNTQTSINLADDVELMHLMTKVGINSTFIGIETPAEDSLQICNKIQNQNRDMLESVKKIQHAGIQVSGGFIVGFDSDLSTIFQRQIDFIQQSGIVSAMVGLLNAPKNTKLYNRLKEENRLTIDPSGSNTDFSMNFIPKMKKADLLEGYKYIITNIYSVKPYYKRVRQFLRNYNGLKLERRRIELPYLLAFLKSIFILGIFSRGRFEYWKLLFWTLFNYPRLVIDAVTFIVYGYHYRAVYGLSNTKLV